MIRTVATGAGQVVTAFPDPAPAYEHVAKRLITYALADGFADPRAAALAEAVAKAGKEIGAHGLGEVVPNLSTGGLTNPLDVLALRWIDAVQSDEPLFDPGYLLS